MPPASWGPRPPECGQTPLGRVPGSQAPLLGLPVARVRVHKGRLTALDGCGLRLVTGSGAGGLRCWDVLELRRAALEQVNSCPEAAGKPLRSCLRT